MITADLPLTHLSVLWYDFMNKKIFPFFYNNLKSLSHLELNFERRLIVVHVKRLKLGKYHLSDILGYPPVLAGEYSFSQSVKAIAHEQKYLMNHKGGFFFLSCEAAK